MNSYLLVGAVDGGSSESVPDDVEGLIAGADGPGARDEPAVDGRVGALHADSPAVRGWFGHLERFDDPGHDSTRHEQHRGLFRLLTGLYVDVADIAT